MMRYRRRGWLSLLLLAGWLSHPAVALAHPGQPLQPHDLWQAWNLSPGLLLGLLAAAALYVGGAARLRRQRALPWWRWTAFAAGWLAIVVALVSPLDRLVNVLFAAHMTQHMLLVLAAAPLLSLGAPLGPTLLALPPARRNALGRAWPGSRLQAVWDWLTRPAVAWALHAGVLWAWHAPGPYQAALQAEWLHSLEHASLLGTAVLFWWVVFHPNRRHAWLRGPGGTLFIFVQALQSGLLGALMTLAARPWYGAYATTTAVWGLSALGDQQLAGAIMWVPAGMAYVVGALGVLGAWLSAAEDARPPVSAGLAQLAAAPMSPDEARQGLLNGGPPS
jgi:putative membrane protein